MSEVSPKPIRFQKGFLIYALAVLLFLPAITLDFAVYLNLVLASYVSAVVCLFLAARAQRSDRFVTVMTWTSIFASPVWIAVGGHASGLIRTNALSTALPFMLVPVDVALLYGIPYLLYRTLALILRGPASRGWRACPALMFHSLTLALSVATLLSGR